MVGSIGPEIYGADDVELLVLLAGLIAPQVGGFLRSEKPAAPVPPIASAPLKDTSAELFFSIAALLATTSDPAAATRLIADEGSRLLPFTDLTVALKLTAGDRVVLLQPGEKRALSNLPLVSVTGTSLGRVLRGEAPNAFAGARGESRLIVPLRVAGKVHGALVFSARPPAELTEAHLAPAQPLADIVAAHFELLRRAAMLPRPSAGGRNQAQAQ